MKYCKYCGKKIKEGSFCHCKKNRENHPELFEEEEKKLIELKNEKNKIKEEIKSKKSALKNVKTKTEKINKHTNSEHKIIDYSFLTNKKVMIPIYSFIMLAVLVVGGYLLFFKNDSTTVAAVRIMEIEDKSYYINNVSKDITFEVKLKENTEELTPSYKLTDEDGKDVPSEIKKYKNNYIIKAIKDFKEGKEYTLVLNGYEFVNEELKERNTLIFKIEREKENTLKYKESVKKAKSNDITVKDDDTLKVDGSYKNGEIILVNDEAAYKIESKNDDGTYEYSVPTIEETFDELDIYIDESPNFEEFILSDEIKEYVLSAVENQEWFDNLLTRVNAKKKDTKINTFNIKQKELGHVILEFSVLINGSDDDIGKLKGNAINFSFLKHHQILLDFSLDIDTDLHIDFSEIVNREMDLYMTIGTEMGITIKHASSKVDFLFDEKDSYTSKEIENITDFMSEQNADEEDWQKWIGGVNIPVGGGFGVSLNLYTLFDLSLNVESSLTFKDTLNINGGYKKRFLKSYEPHGYFRTDPSVEGSIIGKVKTRIGLSTVVGLTFMNMAAVDVDFSNGVYLKASAELRGTLSNGDLSNSLELNAEAGLFAKANLNVIDKSLLSIGLYDNELPLWKANKKYGEKDTKVPLDDETALKIAGPFKESGISKKGETAQEFLNSGNDAVCFLMLQMKKDGIRKAKLKYDEINEYAKKFFGEDIKLDIPSKGWCLNSNIWVDKLQYEPGWKYNSNSKTLVFDIGDSDWGVGGPDCYNSSEKSVYTKYDSAYTDGDYVYVNYKILWLISRYQSSGFWGNDCYDTYKYTDIYKDTSYKIALAKKIKTEKYEIFDKYFDKSNTLTYIFKKVDDHYIFIKNIILEDKEL